jgi:hypothetical protein
MANANGGGGGESFFIPINESFPEGHTIPNVNSTLNYHYAMNLFKLT